MLFRPRYFLWIAMSAICFGQDQEEWSETQIVERFLTLSPQAKELRARVALTEAEGKTRTVYPIPSASFSREGALKRPIAYAIIPVEGNFDFTNLDRWYERDSGERFGIYTLYRLKLRD